MKHTELREIFLNYFKGKKHKVYPSMPLVPEDASLLFTTAGMVQFKDMFLGLVPMEPPGAVSIQKCVRTSDIDRVGKTARHLTFFEMLGNFSAGGYFKEEAITLAWEFLTEVLKLDKEKLYATVHIKDGEAWKLWKKMLPEKKIVKLGDEDNFWTMGETGPCGFCSEIVYDCGEEHGCGRKDCFVGCDCDRWLEVWNLVFTEFDKQPDGKLIPLKQKNIDTGMGFERLLTVVNGLDSNYDTDVIKPLIDRITRSCGNEELSHVRRLADHIRSAVFMISDGVMVSNTGRGYVLRRLIRRAMVSAEKIKMKLPLSGLSSTVVDIFAEVYPELKKNARDIALVIKEEEARFRKTLEAGMGLLEESFRKGGGRLSAELCFDLYTTYGFPVELIKDIALGAGFTVDVKGFEKMLEEEKERSRSSWAGSGDGDNLYLKSAAAAAGETLFEGYEKLVCESSITMLLKDGSEVQSVSAGDECEIIVDRTPFYAASGGQTADTGAIENGSLRAEVTDVAKIGGTFFHRANIVKGSAAKGDGVKCRVDVKRRKAIERNHTATHLLQAALREVVGSGVRQAGSAVNDKNLRFDFTVSRKVTDAELEKTEEIVNSHIMADMEVFKNEYTREEAEKLEALHFFEEKYGDVVRVISIGSKKPASAVSVEFCGGCHVDRTGEIGLLKITSQRALAQGVRRIEAVTGGGVMEYLKDREATLSRASRLLKTNPSDIEKKIEKIVSQLKEKRKTPQLTAADIRAATEDAGGFPVTVMKVDQSGIPSAADEALSITDGVAFVWAEAGKKVSFACRVSKKAVEKGLSAGNIIKSVTASTSGSGGGNERFSRGGGPSSDFSEKKAREAIRKILEGA